MPSSLQLRVHRVGFSHSDVVLLDDVSFACGPGWVGVVGANGSGKSTLLRLISSELEPLGGHITIDGNGSVYRWEQRVDSYGAEVQHMVDASDGRAQKLLGRLSLSAADLARWPTLSPGERTRWQCAAALYLEPEVLLLDEPTNHLDAQSRGLLIASLARFRGIGLIVSHDREVLDALTHATLRLVDGRAQWWPLAYSEAQRAWVADEARVLERHTLKQQALQSAKHRLVEARSELEATTRNRSAGRRMRDKNDSDARGLLADARTARAEQSRSAQKHRLGRQLDSLEQSLGQDVLHFERGNTLRIEAAACPSALAIRLHREVISVGEAPVLSDVHLDIARGAHLAIEGPNGAGKSTLLHAIHQASALPQPTVWCLGQDERADEAEQWLETLREMPRVPRGQVLQWVDCLGADPNRMLRSQALSPGEARKLRLAFGLSKPRALLLLDEPTNHLDLPSIERLQRALHEFEGTLVLVTHDAVLARGCCLERLTVERGVVGASQAFD